MVEWNTGMTLSLFFFPEAVLRVCNGSEWLTGSIKYISAVCQSVEQAEPS